jgi:hypothetical protein
MYEQPPQVPYPPPYGAVLPTSTMAIISLISGIAGFTVVPGIGSIVAVITGMMARNETRASPPTATGDGLATAGIVMGWIGIALSVAGILCACAFFVLPLLGIPFFAVFGGN